jgi:6-phosphofructokinase 1
MSKLGIVVAGGPAPGINSVIAAAVIRARLSGVEVVGIRDGFKWIMTGDTTRVVPLEISGTTRIHYRGGSFLGISRANPTKHPEHMAGTLASLASLGVDKLVTIGGDDTAYSAHRLAQASAGTLRVVHVPKTIDNDLDLPPEVNTFGYLTARSVGVGIVENLMVDAKTTARWYFVVAMGRKAGHLALGIGKAAAATITLIPEEFAGPRARLSTIVDTLAGAIIKRLAQGKHDGVAVLAEGLVEILPESDPADLSRVERDAHDHIRLAEVNFGDIVKAAVRARLEGLGVDVTIVSKNIGYELRCADPVASDMEYCRDLGHSAARFILEGGSGALVSMQGGRFKPIPFADIMDPATGRMRVRMVDLHSERYAIARAFMLRLGQADLLDRAALARIAAVANLSPEQFEREFSSAFCDVAAS